MRRFEREHADGKKRLEDEHDFRKRTTHRAIEQDYAMSNVNEKISKENTKSYERPPGSDFTHFGFTGGDMIEERRKQ